MQFPTYLDQGVVSSKTVFDTSLYRIAHVPFEPGKQAACAIHYLPVWTGGIGFTPVSSPALTFEVDTDMKSTQSAMAGERAHRKNSSQQRMKSAETQDAIAETRTRQALDKERSRVDCRDRLAAKAGWTKQWSRNGRKEYFWHRATNSSCYIEDLEAVIDGTHPTFKLGNQMRK